MITIDVVLYSLVPDAKWETVGDDYAGLTWLDETANKPTKRQIEDERTRLISLYKENEYERLRAAEYPPIGDQLDALWKGGDASTDMLAKVQAVKAKYPKPTES